MKKGYLIISELGNVSQNKMKKEIVILALFLSLPNIVFGCTCYAIESFNLHCYDNSSNIVEIKIIEKVHENYDERLEQYHIDTTNWNIGEPPIQPIRPPNTFVEFTIEIIKVYKGEVKMTTRTLRANDLNTSCHWEPEVGMSYIFYLGSTTINNNDETIEIFGCQRRIRTDNKNYNSEIMALTILKDKKDGKFKVDQSELSKNLNQKFISIQGEFRNGKRHGKWKIAEPINLNTKTTPTNNAITLEYKDDYLKCIKLKEISNKHINTNFIRPWYEYYNERIL